MTDPTLQLLVDPDRLSHLVGEDVRAVRIRPKPDTGHQASLRTRDDDRPWGWLRLLLGPNLTKRDKLLKRASRGIDGHRVGCLELPELQAVLLWGPWSTDPALARTLQHVALGPAGQLQVLRHNPGRRLVLRDGDRVVRITKEPHDAALELGRTLAERGLAVNAASAPAQCDGRLSLWPWIPGHDLRTGEASSLTRAGTELARLHQSSPQGLALPERGWESQLSAARCASEQLAELSPVHGERARSLLGRLPGWVGAGAPVVLHGDLSLDQFLAADDGRVLITDLDRVCLGPAEIDLASLMAVAQLLEHDVEGLLEGYARAMGWSSAQSRAVLGPWLAAALLQRCSQYWRNQDPDWAVLTERLLALVEDAVERDARGEGWTVASHIDGLDRITIARAWPDKVRDLPRVAVEGRDAQGVLRAGRLDTAGAATVLPAGSDPRLPALERVAARGELVVHRAGKRAVVAIPDRNQPEEYVKVVRPGQAGALARAAEHGATVAAAVGLAAPQVIRHDDDTLTMTVLAGRPVHELSGQPGWEGLWRQWAQAWQALQAADPADLLETALPVHGANAEAGVLRTWQRRCAQTGLLDGTEWPTRMLQVADDLATAGDPARLVITHRDLHDKQLLSSADGLGVLDFDTVGLAAPELDLANLAVHASLRRAQGLWSDAARDAAVAAAREVAGHAGVADERWNRASRATVARLAGVYAHRPGWREAVLGWADELWASLVRQ